MPAVIRSPVRHSLLNRRADTLQIVRKIARVQVRLHGHHAAADVHAHCRRNDRALRRDHAAYRRANAPVHVRHGRNPLENKRKLRHVQKLLPRLLFDRYAARPALDRRALFRSKHFVTVFSSLMAASSLFLESISKSRRTFLFRDSEALR